MGRRICRRDASGRVAGARIWHSHRHAAADEQFNALIAIRGHSRGYGAGTSTLLFPGTGHTSDLNPSGVCHSQSGYNWAFDDNIVLGAVGELDIGNLDGGKQPVSGHVGSRMPRAP